MSRIDEALRQAGMASRATQAEEDLPPPLDVFPTSAESEVEETVPPDTYRQEVIAERPLASPPLKTAGGISFAPAEKLVVHQDTGRTSVEQYRRIAAVLHHLQAERGIKVLMVAS